MFNLHFQTVVRVSVEGVVHRSTVFGAFPELDIGPTGVPGAPPTAAGKITFGNYSTGYWAADTGSTLAVLGGDVHLGRGPMSQPLNMNPMCGNYDVTPADYRDCVRYDVTTPAKLSYSIVDASLTMTASATAVPSRGHVAFDLKADPSTIGQWSLNVQGAEWMWTPDDTARWGGPRTPTYPTMQCTGNTHCEYWGFDQSGTIQARAYVNGVMKEGPPAHVTVTDSLTLQVDRSSGPANYLATFHAANSDGTNILVTGWTFTPDSGGAPFSVACPTYQQGAYWDCPMHVMQSGTMSIRASVHYDHYSTASVHVTVVPCPTDDPVLDDPAIRSAFKGLIDESGPALPPGDGITVGTDVGNKREHAGRVYRRPNGTYYFVEDILAVGNECHTSRVPQTSPKAPVDELIAIVHTHPTKTGKVVYGCGPDPVTGEPRKMGPWDSSTVFVAKKRADSTNGGGSDADWNAQRDLPENQVPFHGIDQYVINADGEVWRLLGMDSFTPSRQKGNRLVYKYSGNSNPSCNWVN